MRKNLVLTLTGHDRVGIVEHVTKILLEYGANIDESRMARLGGEFVMLMLISVSAEKFEALCQGVVKLKDQDYEVTTRQTERGYSAKYAGWMPYRVQVSGADHEGIIHHIAHHLAQQGINIETMDTSMTPAPMSGTPLFTMKAVVVVPPNLPPDWREELADVGNRLNVDTEVTSYKG